MHNKKLFDEICNVSCSFDELKKFNSAIDKQEFDLDSPFDKYYSIEKINLAIEKYQTQQVNARFLSCWMNAYNWIIMGGFKIEDEDESISLKEFLIWTISDWLDSLSFFDGSDFYNLEEYKNTFVILNTSLQDLSVCDAVFAQHGCNDDDVVVLIINNTSKYFIKVYGELNYSSNAIGFKKIEYGDLKNQINHLHNLKYQELKYGDWEDED